MPEITRSGGLTTGTGFVVGGGYQGATNELDALVTEAAQVLATEYGMDVTIRFNSDRRSGGAWLKTHEVDGIGANSEIGIGGYIVDAMTNETRRKYGMSESPEGVYVTAHIGRSSLVSPEIATSPSGYYHDSHDSITDALSFVLDHGRV